MQDYTVMQNVLAQSSLFSMGNFIPVKVYMQGLTARAKDTNYICQFILPNHIFKWRKILNLYRERLLISPSVESNSSKWCISDFQNLSWDSLTNHDAAVNTLH